MKNSHDVVDCFQDHASYVNNIDKRVKGHRKSTCEAFK